MIQDEIFLSSEGDRWFERNKSAIATFQPEGDFHVFLARLYRLRPSRIIELGASTGGRVSYLAKEWNAAGVAVEPSESAVSAGSKAYPHVQFYRGTLANYPSDVLKSGQFDLAIVNFVFHWVDRESLSDSVAGVDRLIAPKGFLLLGDFFPSKPTQVPYHHLPGQNVFTFKEDYSQRFLSLGYSLVAMLTGSHSAAHETRLGTGSLPVDSLAPDHERMGFWLLRKRLD